MRELPLDEGKIVYPPHYRIQCLTQNPQLTAGNTLQEELYSVFTELNEAKEEEQKADNIIIEKNEQVQQIKKEVAVKPLFSGVSQFQMMDILAKGASIVQSSGLSAPKKQGF